MWHFVDLCCGSGAITLHLLGARKAILPYQGSKWKLRGHIASYCPGGAPQTVTLVDPSPWSETLGVVINPKKREQLVSYLECLAAKDPREVYDSLQGHSVPEDLIERAGQHLFLQRLAFSGKAVGVNRGNWSSPGFNGSSAYGIPATDKFGAINPMIPSLIKTLKSYNLEPTLVRTRRGRAAVPEKVPPNTFVYIDPPYQLATPYPDGSLGRDEVIWLAQQWRERGASVLISEREPIVIPGGGWWVKNITAGRDIDSPFVGKHSEWLTGSNDL